MNEFTQEQALWAVEGVEFLHDATSQYLQDCGLDPTPTSKAASELIEFENPEPIRTAYSQGNLRIEYAADHLMGFVKAYREPAVTISPFTCVRTIIEVAATAIWLLDDKITASTRVQRSIRLRLKGLSEQQKFRSSLPDRDNGDEMKLKQRIARLEQLASPNVPMLSSIELIAKTLDQESNYRLLSSFAHGYDWAIHQLSFQIVRDDPMHGRKFLEKTVNPTAVIFLCHTAARAFTKLVWCKSNLFGFDLTQLAQVHDEAFAKIGIGEPSAHFWH
jgi:hypothetical protein